MSDTTGICPVCYEPITREQVVTTVDPEEGPPCAVHITCAYPDIDAGEMAAYPTAGEVVDAYSKSEEAR
jgi:hypothetical protein